MTSYKLESRRGFQAKRLPRFQWILAFYIRYLDSKSLCRRLCTSFRKPVLCKYLPGVRCRSFSFVRSFSTFIHSLVRSPAEIRAKVRRRPRRHGYRRKMFKYLPWTHSHLLTSTAMFLDFRVTACIRRAHIRLCAAISYSGSDKFII